MVENKSILEKLTKFYNIDEFEDVEAKVKDENMAQLLLCSLSRSFEQFKDAILYGKEDTITLNEV